MNACYVCARTHDRDVRAYGQCYCGCHGGGSRRPTQASELEPQRAAAAGRPPTVHGCTGPPSPCPWWLADTGGDVAHDCDCVLRAGHDGAHRCICGATFTT